MNPLAQAFAEEAKAAFAEGRFVAALAARMEYVDQRAKRFLADKEFEIRWSRPPASLMEKYLTESELLSGEVERLGEEAPIELVAARYICAALSDILNEMATPGPVDGERIAKLLLHGMDLATVDYFCSQIDDIDAQVETADLAQRYLELIQDQPPDLALRFYELRESRKAGAHKANLVRSGWHTNAFIAYAAYLYFNPGETAWAKRKATQFVKGRSDKDPDEGALAKALQRKPELFADVTKAVEAFAKGDVESIPPPMRESVAAAMAAFNPCGQGQH